MALKDSAIVTDKRKSIYIRDLKDIRMAPDNKRIILEDHKGKTHFFTPSGSDPVAFQVQKLRKIMEGVKREQEIFEAQQKLIKK